MPHTMERAGNPTIVSPRAIPSVASHEAGGYVGGGRLLHNGVFARGAGTVTGPVTEGTFGTDYAGLKVRPGRVFLAPSPDPGAAQPIARGYRTDGPHVPDVFALRPFRKALFEKK